MKLKIGEFARLGKVSVQTLRYYDDLNLLKPAAVDPFSGYRYYTLEQLPDLARVLVLKDLGFALEQIPLLLAANFSPADLRRALLQKRQELQAQVQDQLERIERLEARLQGLDQGAEAAPYEVFLKAVEAQPAATLRGVIASYWDVGPLWERLFRALAAAGLTPAGPCLTICHAVEPQIELEVCAPLASDRLPDAPLADGVRVRWLDGEAKMACTYHHGPFTGLADAFTALLTWVDHNPYEVCGPDREIYLRLPQPCQYDRDPDALTELQIPVRRKVD